MSDEQRAIILSKIPIIIFKKPEHNEFESCAICIGDFEEGNRVKLLETCQHMFHEDCIDSWILKSRGNNVVCPVCRADLKLNLESSEISHDALPEIGQHE